MPFYTRKNNYMHKSMNNHRISCTRNTRNTHNTRNTCRISNTNHTYNKYIMQRMSEPLSFIPITDPMMIEKLNKKFGPTLTDDERWELFTKQRL